jgi:hypothetical protein
MMQDYLLRFPSKAIAEQFGVASGFAVVNEDGSVTTTLATHQYALHEIGEHNGKDYWFLFRDLVGLPVPEGADQFIFWASTSDTLRPTDDPTVPTIFWA